MADYIWLLEAGPSIGGKPYAPADADIPPSAADADIPPSAADADIPPSARQVAAVYEYFGRLAHPMEGPNAALELTRLWLEREHSAWGADDGTRTTWSRGEMTIMPQPEQAKGSTRRRARPAPGCAQRY